MTFPCVRILVERGQLHLHGAYFGVATGALLLRDPATGAFAPAVAELPSRYRCEPLSRTGEGQG